MALSGGETARACYERLAGRAGFDWNGVELFMGDERCVPPGDPAANQRLVRESLLDRISAKPAFYPMDCAHIEEYQDLLAGRPGFDLLHLGFGPDGHTASLFPASEALDARPGTLVTKNVDPSGRNPFDRVTITFEQIARAKLAVFTVAGAAKHDALARLLRGEDLPASKVRAENVLWLCDEEALGDLTP